MRFARTAATTAALCALLGGAGTTALAAPNENGVDVVADHLDNPRGITITRDGTVYVAEAGRGGSDCVDRVGGGELCYGRTGAVTRVRDDDQVRVVTGLASVSGTRRGYYAIGAGDVARTRRTSYVPVGGTICGTPSSDIPAELTRQLGRLLAKPDNGLRTVVANVGNFECTRNPDGGARESNPYSVAALNDREQYVVDPSANALLRVRDRRVTLAAVFPRNRAGKESVPTSVTVGPDKALYVGELGGDGTPNDQARIFRIVPGRAPRVWATGFTRISDLAFDGDGNLYVTEFDDNVTDGHEGGAVVRVDTDGSRKTMGDGDVHNPTGVALDDDDNVYVSIWGNLPGNGAPGSGPDDPHGQVIKLAADNS